MKDYVRPILRYWLFLKPFLKHVIIIVLLSYSMQAALLAQPLLVKRAIDSALSTKNIPLLILLFFGVILIYAVYRLTHALERYRRAYVQQRIAFSFKKHIVRHVGALDVAYFARHDRSRNVYRLSFDSDRIAEALISLPIDSLIIVVNLLSSIAIIAYLDLKMAVFAACIAPALLIPTYLLSHAIYNTYQRVWTSAENAFMYMHGLFNHIWIIKACFAERAFVNTIKKMLFTNTKTAMRAVKLEIAHAFIQDVGVKILSGVFVLYGAIRVASGELPISTVIAIFVYVSYLLATHTKIAYLYKMCSMGSAACERVNGVLDCIPTITDAHADPACKVHDTEIEVRNVSFSYAPGKPVFENISTTFPAGAIVGIAGRSGVGKSTLVQLLIRLRECCEGSLVLSGHPIETIPLSVLSAHVSIALQEPFLFNASVRDNITLFNSDISDDRVAEVLSLCDIDDSIDTQHTGGSVSVGELGECISDGQKQRIALARALIRKPSILIIDEALSSLDSQKEAAIVKNIRAFLPRSLIIIVSHRLSTIAHCSHICFIQDSRTVYMDTRDSLWEKSPHFRDIFQDQIDVVEFFLRNTDQ